MKAVGSVIGNRGHCDLRHKGRDKSDIKTFFFTIRAKFLVKVAFC